MSSAVDFYKLPFKDAKKYLRRIYLSLDFIDELNLDPTSLNLRAFYLNSSLAPILLINDKTQINKYLSWGSTEYTDWLAKKEKKPVSVPPANSILIGYKHFDKWKFEDGTEIGSLRSQDQKIPAKELRLQRMIQKKILGWKYWIYRGLRKI